MNWMDVEKLLAAKSDLQTIETAIIKQKEVLHYLQSQQFRIEREIQHLEYRKRIERETTVKVVTGEDK